METIKIELYEENKAKPETTITVPLNVIRISKGLLPSKVKSALDKLGINTSQFNELFDKKCPQGKLIEIDTSKEKIVISVG